MSLITAVSRATGLLRVVVVAGAWEPPSSRTRIRPPTRYPICCSSWLPQAFSLRSSSRRSSATSSRDAGGLGGRERPHAVALVGLMGLSLLLALAAPVLMRLMTIGIHDPTLRADEIALGADLIRFFAPR